MWSSPVALRQTVVSDGDSSSEPADQLSQKLVRVFGSQRSTARRINSGTDEAPVMARKDLGPQRAPGGFAESTRFWSGAR
jgi:hypothetical protein